MKNELDSFPFLHVILPLIKNVHGKIGKIKMYLMSGYIVKQSTLVSNTVD